ncbi:MAG: glutamate--tRNA ligase [Lachnospiraceae bacterium]|jgi:glutamyl-tRNA synthetase|nr:glutamate--tRNA ligase [uncultured Acetatifactor sp.]MCI9219050.1 glutamate--tRNA ligase [Lachnospiraceae bacterium]
MKIRTRYAPSPTGKMHVGNLRSALYEFLIAKHAGGVFMLRIEDTDQERFVEGATEIIYRTLKQVGLEHDEGPDKDGGFGPYVQSERMKTGIYTKYAKELIDRGEAYYCFCDKERLDSLKTEVVEGKEITIYDKHCLSLSKEEVEANLAAGRPYVIRQNNPSQGTTTFHDELYGDITVENAELDDMILIKSDGYPTYNFANVVDDHTMGITHVVRGNEYLSSSPKYTRLYEAFGWEAPKYVHLPLVTDENHKKLAKRSGHSSFEDLTEQGFLPEAVVNYIALLGWSPEDNREIFSLDELIREFDYHRISKSPAVFDIVKLRWMNGEYIKAMDFDAFYQMAEPYLKKAITKELDLRKIAAMVKTRIEVFPDIVEMVDFFEKLPEYDIAMYTHKKMKTNEQSSLEVLTELLPLLEAQEDYSNDGLYQTLAKYVEDKGVKNGYVMWPVRSAVSGRQTTPAGATEIMEVLGREESLKRIRRGIQLLKAAAGEMEEEHSMEEGHSMED